MAAVALGVGARPGRQGKQSQHAADQDDRGRDVGGKCLRLGGRSLGHGDRGELAVEIPELKSP